MITFEPLRQLMDERDINYTYLRENGLSTNAATALKNDGSVRLETIDKLCEIFNCRIEDVMQYVPDQK